jgi:hypothetical protein
MLKTNMKLKNPEIIQKLLRAIVQESYNEVKEEKMLLCMECGDVDLYIAISNNEGLQEAINENFELDEFGEVIDRKSYNELIEDLHEYYIDIFRTNGLFDFFPSGYYQVKGETRLSETDMLGPKQMFYAPFEDALVKENE